MSYLEQNQDDEKIITFTESKPATYKPFTRTDLENAEDQTEEIEEAKDQEDEEKDSQEEGVTADEFDDNALASMSLEVLSVVRFMPRHRTSMEYGTPAGIEPPITGTCPSCADAADAAIIDNEIGEDKPSEEPGAKEDVEKRKESATGGDSSGGDEGDLSADDIGSSDTGDEGDMGDLGDNLGTEESAEENPSDASEGDENADAGGEIMKYLQMRKSLYQEQLKESYFYGNEDFWGKPLEESTNPAEDYYNETRHNAIRNFLGNLLVGISKIIIKVANIANKIYMSCRDLIAKNFIKKSTIHKFLNFKLNKLLNQVDEHRMLAYSATAYPMDEWISTAKTALTMYGAVLNCKTLIYDDPKELLSPKLAKLKALMTECGIEISTSHNSVNIDASLDKRKNDSLGELGYTKKEIPNLVRYFGEIANRIPDKKTNKLEAATDLQIEHIGHLRKDFEQNIKSGKYKKGSEDAEKAEKALVTYATRMDYILLMQKGVFMLFDVLLSDMMTVCRKIENSMEASALID